jgi:hypothetical protein
MMSAPLLVALGGVSLPLPLSLFGESNSAPARPKITPSLINRPQVVSIMLFPPAVVRQGGWELYIACGQKPSGRL